MNISFFFLLMTESILDLNKYQDIKKVRLIRKMCAVPIQYINAIAILLLYYYVAKNQKKK